MEASHNEATVPENVAIQSRSIQCPCIDQPSKPEESKTEKILPIKGSTFRRRNQDEGI